MFEAKDESRKQAAAADKAREAAVEEAVSRVNRQVEESMSETYRYGLAVQRMHGFTSIDFAPNFCVVFDSLRILRVGA